MGLQINMGLQNIKEWPEQERPRERLFLSGPESLSDGELLAILLRTGSRGKNAVDLGRYLLSRMADLRSLGRATPVELASIPGVGRARAAQILAAAELGRRIGSLPISPGEPARTSGDVFRHFRPLFAGKKAEEFHVLLLDTRHRLIRTVPISKGSLSASVVHPREVFLAAIRESAAAMILIHNHPSGEPTPSPEDRRLTERLAQAGEILGVPVLDHVVVGEDSYYSFADHKEIDLTVRRTL